MIKTRQCTCGLCNVIRLIGPNTTPTAFCATCEAETAPFQKNNNKGKVTSAKK